MVGCTAIGKVMMVVCSNMRISARLLKKLGKRIVKRFQRAPATVQEIDAARVQIPPGGNAGQTADIVVVKSYGTF